MKTELYPLKFHPVYKEKIWGGNKLNTILKKNIPSEHTGESWEISAIEGSVSQVSNGPLKGKSLTELQNEYGESFVGKKIYETSGEEFPLLFKFIDAKENLSLQVHPDDVLAKKRHNSLGKTEMWYIMQADENAGIYVGFSKGTTKKDYLDHLEKEDLQSIMNFEPVQSGDVFFIKPGLVHAIGKGVLLAEIQQSSDITYRVYDWNRKDNQGNGRALHTELALDAIGYDFDGSKVDYELKPNKLADLVKNKYFNTKALQIKSPFSANYQDENSFVVLMCVEGKGTLTYKDHSIELIKGETVLLPFCIDAVDISAEHVEILQVSID